MYTVHKIKSAHLRAKGERIEGVNHAAIAKRLTEIQKMDPAAKIISIPAAR